MRLLIIVRYIEISFFFNLRSANPEAQRIGMALMNIFEDPYNMRGTVKDWLRDTFQKSEFQNLNKANMVQLKSNVHEPVDPYESASKVKVLTSEMLEYLSVSQCDLKMKIFIIL